MIDFNLSFNIFSLAEKEYDKHHLSNVFHHSTKKICALISFILFQIEIQ